jgi:23S rRNA (cytosine1962-C5)-methyltransferase
MELKREPAVWSDYQLLDSGDFEKLERFGAVTVIRPEPLALWTRSNPDLWTKAQATYSRVGEEGDWELRSPLPSDWQITWEDLRFKLRTTSFKHTGIFPEQAANWRWIRETVKPGMKVLNLFGYTGGATIAAASAGAEVVHLDSSKPAVTWAKENAELSGLAEKPIRFIVDDVQKFVAREIRRDHKYDAIFLDPPAFGRGPDGEVWRFEENLPGLLEQLTEILNQEHGYLLLNAYSLGFPALSIEQMVRTNIPFVKHIEAVELTLEEATPRAFKLPTGIAVRASW